MNDTDHLPGLQSIGDSVAKLRERIEINEQRMKAEAGLKKPLHLVSQSAGVAALRAAAAVGAIQAKLGHEAA